MQGGPKFIRLIELRAVIFSSTPTANIGSNPSDV